MQSLRSLRLAEAIWRNGHAKTYLCYQLRPMISRGNLESVENQWGQILHIVGAYGIPAVGTGKT